MDKENENLISLIELQGIISNLAIDDTSGKHDRVLGKIDMLINKYGVMRTVDADFAIKLLYK